MTEMAEERAVGPAESPERALRRRGLAALLAVVVAALDQALKYVVVDHVMQPPRIIEVTGFFNIVLAYNRGVSFSLFTSDSAMAPLILSAIALLIVIGLSVWIWRMQNFRLSLAVALIIGGALGNVIDRIRLGAVVDFIDLHYAGWHWPAFNLADSAITLGAILVLLDGLLRRPHSA